MERKKGQVPPQPTIWTAAASRHVAVLDQLDLSRTITAEERLLLRDRLERSRQKSERLLKAFRRSRERSRRV